ncbi:MAG: CIA30 family protein [Nitrosomonadales bacterium]
MTDTVMPLMIDDRRHDDLCASNQQSWRVFTDTVMGGVSSADLIATVREGVSCLRLRGQVSLENNGGFVQASLDLGEAGSLDASAYRGIELRVCGNGEIYNLHLRTDDTRIVWQSYRASFKTTEHWQAVRLAFDEFTPHRIDTQLDRSRLRRLGIVAIGKVMQADICLASIRFYA